VRERAGHDLAFLGVSIDQARNRADGDDREIGTPGAAVRSFVIAAREDLEIAHEVREVLAVRRSPGS
jgi:acetate kinase